MNLTKTAAFVKKFFKYLFLFVGSYYLVTLVILPGSVAIIKAIFVKKVPYNTAYGQLEQLVFSPKKIKNDTYQFILDTNDAKLPENLPDRMTVYKFIPQQYSYLAGKNAQDEAATLGFTEKDLTSDLSGTVYRWRNSVTASNLTIDINSRKLELATNLSGKGSNYKRGSIDENSARDRSRGLLSSIYRFSDELYPKGTQKVRLGTYSGNKLQETKNSSEAQLALVDLYRSIGDYPILGPDPDVGLLRVIVAANPDSKPNPLKNPLVETYYWEINTQSKAAYPIITPQVAWDIVKEGGGVIASVVPKDSNPFEDYLSVQIDKIYVDTIFLAYYETPEFQTYLQPIYVFSGTYTTRGSSEGGNIAIYFPAITAEWLKQENPPEK